MSTAQVHDPDSSVNTIDLSILTVGFNSAAHLEKCLASLGPDLARPNIEMLFVDNGTDGSAEMLSKLAPLVSIIPSRGNIGFGRACNLLASHAAGRLLLFLNPDTEVRPGAIEAMLESAAKFPEFAILGAMTLTVEDGSQRFPQLELPGMLSLARGMIGRAARPFPARHDGLPISVNCVSGGCMMVRSEEWDILGGFDEGFFLYAEDIDLCKRATDKGLKLGVVPDAKIYHDLGSGTYFAPNRLMFQMRANAHYFRKHFNPIHSFGCLCMLWLSAAIRFGIGGLAGIATPKYREMSNGFRAVALYPWKWWRGYLN